MKTKTQKYWTLKEIAYLRQNYPFHTTAEISEKLGRSKHAIYTVANKYGIKKDESFLQSKESGRYVEGHEKNVLTRFKKGMTPWNKGKKGLTKKNSGAFTKGNIPHNIKTYGSKRTTKDGYTLIKVRGIKRWVLYHNYVWEQVHGRIPAGHIVSFKDGDRHNLKIDNLQLVSRYEHLQKNSINRYPADIKRAIKTLSKFKQIIKQQQDGTK
jgi:hypothetical protein